MDLENLCCCMEDEKLQEKYDLTDKQVRMYSEFCPSCGEYAVQVGSEAMCDECGWAEDRRHTY